MLFGSGVHDLDPLQPFSVTLAWSIHVDLERPGRGHGRCSERTSAARWRLAWKGSAVMISEAP
jgi:hypothetical protein